jgi:hypothetical protein
MAKLSSAKFTSVRENLHKGYAQTMEVTKVLAEKANISTFASSTRSPMAA